MEGEVIIQEGNVYTSSHLVALPCYIPTNNTQSHMPRLLVTLNQQMPMIISNNQGCQNNSTSLVDPATGVVLAG